MKLTNMLDILHCIILVKKHFWKLSLLPTSRKGRKPSQLVPVNGSPRIEIIPEPNFVEDGKADLLYQLLNI